MVLYSFSHDGLLKLLVKNGLLDGLDVGHYDDKIPARRPTVIINLFKKNFFYVK